jgi:DNA-binding CsgD family transcriptional regulator
MRIPYGSFSFFFFVTWLVAVPMEGPLLGIGNASGLSLWFIVSHVFFLVMMAHFVPAAKWTFLARFGAVVCTLLTSLLFLWHGPAIVLLLLLGAAAAPMAVMSCLGLLQAVEPLRSAAWCLVLGNIVLALVQHSLKFPVWPLIFAILPLLTLPRMEPAPHRSTENLSSLWEYLPFIFLFQIISGLMYAFLFPAYARVGWGQGSELLFYMGAVLGAVFLYERNRDLLLICGLGLGMVAFVWLQVGGGPFINLSMFAMMGAAGCIDLFLLGLLLQNARSAPGSFAFGLATLCCGIAAGQTLSLVLGTKARTIGLAGSMTLNVAALTLVVWNQHRLRRRGADISTRTEDESRITIPTELGCVLSERERHVLELVLQGRNYREAADCLSISESTVKTYMKRICDKVGASDRKQLLQRLARG